MKDILLFFAMFFHELLGCPKCGEIWGYYSTGFNPYGGLDPFGFSTCWLCSKCGYASYAQIEDLKVNLTAV